MTARKVVELHPPAAPKPNVPTGYQGKVWSAVQVRATHEWAVQGHLPDRPNSLTDLMLMRHAAGGKSEELARETARRLMQPGPIPYETQEESA